MVFDAIRNYMNASIPFLRHASIEIGEITQGAASAELPDKPELKNHIGSAHAAALFAVGETASGAALGSTLGEMLTKTRPVAASASIKYVKVAKGPIRADAKVDRDAAELLEELHKNGKIQFEIQVDMYDPSDAKVAIMTVDWHVSLPR